ncbi:PQQ-binding-like beta-propeller repeat protein [Gemmatimonadota bacterium]
MIHSTASRAVFTLSLVLFAMPVTTSMVTGTVIPGRGGEDQSPGERIWDRELDGRTESLQVVGNDTVVRLGSRSIEAYGIETGDLIWGAARDGAGSVMVSGVEGTPFIVLLHRFDRPPPAAGRAEGTSWKVSLYRHDSTEPVWTSGPRVGDVIDCRPVPDQDRILVLVRNDEGDGLLSAISLGKGEFLWDVEYGELDRVPHGERALLGRYFTTAGDRLFRVDRRERTVSLAAHDLSDGDLKWVGYLQGEEYDLWLTTRDGNLYVTGAKFTSIDPVSGSVLWQLSEPWVPLDERMPWMLARHPDSTRLQLIHVNSGEERWRSIPRTTGGTVAHTIWFPVGVLAGGERGETALYSVADASRISSVRTRYIAPGRSGTEKIFALPDGLLFVRSGPKGNIVLRTDTSGSTRWQTELSVPGPGIEEGDSEGVSRNFSAPVGIEADGSGGSIWITGAAGAERVITRVDLQTGQERESHSLLGTTPVFAVSAVQATLIFIAGDGTLVAVSY